MTWKIRRRRVVFSHTRVCEIQVLPPKSDDVEDEVTISHTRVSASLPFPLHPSHRLHLYPASHVGPVFTPVHSTRQQSTPSSPLSTRAIPTFSQFLPINHFIHSTVFCLNNSTTLTPPNNQPLHSQWRPKLRPPPRLPLPRPPRPPPPPPRLPPRSVLSCLLA